MVNIIETAATHPRIRVTGMPGKHVSGPMETINNYAAAVRVLYSPKTWKKADGVDSPDQRLDGRTRLRKERHLHGWLPDLHLGRYINGRRPQRDPQALL